MTDLRKAAEMAVDWFDGCQVNGIDDTYEAAVAAAEALRQALAQPEQESVGACVTCGAPKGEWLVDAVNTSQERVDETAKREHEPVAWFIQYEYRHEFLWRKPNELEQKTALEIKPLYTAPPKREWVGLTDEDIGAWPVWSPEIDAFVRNIEAKLKEKNT